MCGCGKKICEETTTNCGCGSSQNTNPCTASTCACPVYISTDCVNNVKAVFSCSNIASGLTLTQTLEELDTFICDKFNELSNRFAIVNVGGGAEVYKGVSGIGNKQLRTIYTDSNLLTVSQETEKIKVGTNTQNLIDFVVAHSPATNYDSVNVGFGAQIFKDEVSNTFNFRSLKSSDATVEISVSGNEIDFKTVDTNTTYTGSNGVTLTGTNFTHSDTSSVSDLTPASRTYVKSLTFDTFGHVTGHTVGTETDQVIDGSETKVTAGANTTVTGDGTAANPYVVSSVDTTNTYTAGAGLELVGNEFKVKNLQKIITSSYTLQASDIEYTIFISNGSSNITITIPTGLPANFEIGFIQQGTGVVTFTSSGAVINTPTGLKIKGQNYQAFLEKVLNTEVYHLLGNVIA